MSSDDETFQTINLNQGSASKLDPIGQMLFPEPSKSKELTEAQPAKEKELSDTIDSDSKPIVKPKEKKRVTYQEYVMNAVKELHDMSYHTSRISWDQQFMVQAIVASLRSSCKKLHVGAVIVSKDKRILSTGYNGFPASCPHVSHERHGHEIRTIHAEQNAIAYAARKGIAIENSCIYVTHYPCIICTKFILAAGIKEVIYCYDYKNDDEATKLFLEMGIKVRKFELKL